MTYKYDIVTFIGRFEPLHVGHLDVIKTALSISRNVVILVGSSNQPRTIKNPFTYDERRTMILDAIEQAGLRVNNVSIVPLRDQQYNDQRWATDVQTLVDQQIQQIGGNDLKVGLIGHNKDDSSYYLKMFPQWHLIEHELNDAINATDLRNLLFEGKSLKFLQGVAPNSALQHITTFTETAEYKHLCDEYHMIKAYKKAWEAAPYPPIFVTVDAVVIQSGHILMVERGASPGKGLLALVGGFLNPNEWIVDGMIRELREETKLKVPTPVLKGSIKQSKVYDRPDRSLRGRTITHAYLIELPPGALPPVKGSDDAARAFWIPISEVREDQCFEDHYAIIQDLVGIV